MTQPEGQALADELALGLRQVAYVLKSIANGDSQQPIAKKSAGIVEAAADYLTALSTDKPKGEGQALADKLREAWRAWIDGPEARVMADQRRADFADKAHVLMPAILTALSTDKDAEIARLRAAHQMIASQAYNLRSLEAVIELLHSWQQIARTALGATSHE